MNGLETVILPVQLDNYVYLLDWGGEAAVVDPGEAEPVLAELYRRKLRLSSILLTHHHQDHVGGVPAIKKAVDCATIGPDDDRIPGLTMRVGEGSRFELGPAEWQVYHTPGHGRSHVAYYSPSHRLLFSGDILFAAGCGRILEGTAEDLWTSLNKLAALPEETRIYCGHEYTLENLQFAAELQPDYAPVQTRLAEVRKRRRESRPTVPSTLALEKITNPFLRAGSPGIRAVLNMPDAPAVEVFAELRRRKDRFG